MFVQEVSFVCSKEVLLMNFELMDHPIDVDMLFSTRPELFPHPIPTLEKRRTVFVGELVKIVVGIREHERLVSGRWLIVESISSTDTGLQAVGRSWKPYYEDDFRYAFGPGNIYRMEPRRFYLWGSGGVPVALRSGEGPDERKPARPMDAQLQTIDGCEQVILEFTALGKLAAEEHYRSLASKNANWPSFDDLK
jgi:hypothetical protein